jgi:hypothetical protein
MTLLKNNDGSVSHFGGIDPMEKWKRQQDAESGGGILTYMQKVGKNDFYQRTFKSDPSPKKLPNQKEKCIVTSNKKLKNQIK